MGLFAGRWVPNGQALFLARGFALETSGKNRVLFRALFLGLLRPNESLIDQGPFTPANENVNDPTRALPCPRVGGVNNPAAGWQPAPQFSEEPKGTLAGYTCRVTHPVQFVIEA